MATATQILTITDAKNLIKDKLTNDFANELSVEMLLKGRIEDFQTDHPKGALIVHYDGSRFSESKSSSITLQDRLKRIAILLQIRIEHGVGFKDELIDRVINSISGLKIKSVTKTDRTRMQSDEYLAAEREESKAFYEHSIVALVPAEFKQADENI
jgi:hypothetical protein